ncbi:MAG: MoaD/ThiS family protein [Candidatus Nanohaloarchaea archaeon]
MDSEKQRTVEVDEEVTVSEFLDSEGVNPEEVLVARNGTIISSTHVLEENDTIRVMDVIAGG